jgi:HPt (histidine-containing phosphotransfer) domain-containing protein
LLALFLDVLPETMDGIRCGIDDNHALNTRNAAHTLKGVSGNIRAMEVFRIAGELEKIGASGDLSGAGEAYVRLESAVARLTAALRSTLEEDREKA